MLKNKIRTFVKASVLPLIVCVVGSADSAGGGVLLGSAVIGGGLVAAVQASRTMAAGTGQQAKSVTQLGNQASVGQGMK